MSFQNWHEKFDEFWPKHLKVSNISTWMCSFWAKYILLQLKRYRGVIFHDTDEWCKIWRKTDLWFGKWHEEFGKFSPEHLKMSKLGLWWILLSIVENAWAWNLQRSYVSWQWRIIQKLKRKWLAVLKLTRNFTNFDPSTWKPKKFAF